MDLAYEQTNEKGVTYYLNKKEVTLRGDQKQTIYFFSKDFRRETSTGLPDDFEVIENKRNGFLVLSKKI